MHFWLELFLVTKYVLWSLDLVFLDWEHSLYLFETPFYGDGPSTLNQGSIVLLRVSKVVCTNHNALTIPGTKAPTTVAELIRWSSLLWTWQKMCKTRATSLRQVPVKHISPLNIKDIPYKFIDWTTGVAGEADTCQLSVSSTCHSSSGPI